MWKRQKFRYHFLSTSIETSLFIINKDTQLPRSTYICQFVTPLGIFSRLLYFKVLKANTKDSKFKASIKVSLCIKLSGTVQGSVFA